MGFVLRTAIGSVADIVHRRHIGCGLGDVDVLLRGFRRAVSIALDLDELASVCVGVDVDRGVLVDVAVHVVAVVVAVVVAELLRRAAVIEVVVVIVEIDGEHAPVACIVLQHGLEIGKLGLSALRIVVGGAVRLAVLHARVERLAACVGVGRFGCLGRLDHFPAIARLGALNAFLAVERGVSGIRRFGFGCLFGFARKHGRCHDCIRNLPCTVAVFALRRLCSGFCGGVFAGWHGCTDILR